MKKQHFYLLFFVLVIAGFLAGINLHPSPSEDRSPARFSLNIRKNPVPRTAVGLSKSLTKVDPSIRWLTWVAKAETASLDDFPMLVAAAQGDRNLLRLLLDEWRRRDPDHLLQSFASAPESRWNRSAEDLPLNQIEWYLYQNWLVKNPGEVIPKLSGLKPSEHLQRLQKSALQFLVDQGHGHQEIFRLAQEWKVNVSVLPRKGILAAAKSNPEAVLRGFLSFVKQQKAWHSGNVSFGATRQIFIELGKIWGASGPLTALSVKSDVREFADFQKTVFREWTARDYEASSVWLGEQKDLKFQDQLRPVLLEFWSREDPEAAFQWCREHLDDSRFRSTLGAIVDGAMEHSLEEIIDLVDGEAPGELRNELAGKISRFFFHDDNPFREEKDRSKVQRGITWMKSLKDASLVEHLLQQQGYYWMRHDPESMITFLAEEKNVGLSDAVFVKAAEELVNDGGSEAMKWAGSFEGEREARMVSGVFNRWVDRNPDQASQWLRDLPAGSDLRKRSVEILVTHFQFTPVRRKLIQDLSIQDREIARATLEKKPPSDRNRQEYLKLLQ